MSIIHKNCIISAKRAVPGSTLYCMSKIALDMFTNCLCAELGPHGVRANAINPGAVETNFLNAAGVSIPDKIRDVSLFGHCTVTLLPQSSDLDLLLLHMKICLFDFQMRRDVTPMCNHFGDIPVSYTHLTLPTTSRV